MEEREKVIELLEEIKRKNFLVIVEGQKDVRSLSELGLTRVLSLSKPIFSVVEEVSASEKEVVVLTDLDSEGKKLFHELSAGLQRHRVKIHNKLRNFLFKTPVRHIEGLSSWLTG